MSYPNMFLLDTSILSHSQKSEPIPSVAAWLRCQEAVAIPFPVLLETEQGIVELEQTKPGKASELREWFETVLASAFVYPAITADVAKAMARLTCCKALKNFWYPNPQSLSEKRPSQDLFIAAIAIVYELPIATLNSRDFLFIHRFAPLPGIYNPALARWVVTKSGEIGKEPGGRPNETDQDEEFQCITLWLDKQSAGVTQ